MPRGDTYHVGDNIKINFSVRDSQGVSSFSWGVFAQNRTPLKSGNESCNGQLECNLSIELSADLPGQFEVGVEAVNRNSGKTVQSKQIYIN